MANVNQFLSKLDWDQSNNNTISINNNNNINT